MTERAALIEKIHALLERRLDADDAAALKERLRTDPAARKLYIEVTDQRAALRWQFARPEAVVPAAPGTAPHADAEPAPGEASGTTPGTSPYPIYRKGYEPQPSRIRPHHYAFAGIAAALLAACGLAVYLLAFNAPTDPQPGPSQPGPRVATLIENTGTLTTPHGFPAEGDDFSAGEYTLDRGDAEFMLTNSVNVKLRGPTRMVMHNDMNVALTRGSAAFVVPKGAIGFTVALPGGHRVVDLGTSFDVRVDEAGSAVLVREGLVALHSDVDHHRLSAGEAVRIDASGAARPLRLNSLHDAGLPADWFGDRTRAYAFDTDANDWVRGGGVGDLDVAKKPVATGTGHGIFARRNDERFAFNRIAHGAPFVLQFDVRLGSTAHGDRARFYLSQNERPNIGSPWIGLSGTAIEYRGARGGAIAESDRARVGEPNEWIRLRLVLNPADRTDGRHGRADVLAMNLDRHEADFRPVEGLDGLDMQLDRLVDERPAWDTLVLRFDGSAPASVDRLTVIAEPAAD